MQSTLPIKKSRHWLRPLIALSAVSSLMACAPTKSHMRNAEMPAADYDSGAMRKVQPTPPAPAASTAPAAPTAPRTTHSKATPTADHAGKRVFAGTVQGATIDQMLIFTGRLDLMAAKEDIAQRIEQAIEIAAQMGGYISKQDNNGVTVRVPSSGFRQAMNAIAGLGEVVQRTVHAQDVSEEYHDLGVRLQSLKATRKRLEDFLKRAKNIEEVLRLEKELARLAGDIDKIEGRMRYLSARAAFSTITVTFTPRPKPKVVAASKPAPPPPPPPPRTVPLPIDWLDSVGIDSLLDLR